MRKDVARYDEELERISNNISTLSNAKASSIQVRDTTSSTGFRQTIVLPSLDYPKNVLMLKNKRENLFKQKENK